MQQTKTLNKSYQTTKYRRELLTALDILERIAEESGLYGEAKLQAGLSVAKLREFINNRLD